MGQEDGGRGPWGRPSRLAAVVTVLVAARPGRVCEVSTSLGRTVSAALAGSGLLFARSSLDVRQCVCVVTLLGLCRAGLQPRAPPCPWASGTLEGVTGQIHADT